MNIKKCLLAASLCVSCTFGMSAYGQSNSEINTRKQNSIILYKQSQCKKMADKIKKFSIKSTDQLEKEMCDPTKQKSRQFNRKHYSGYFNETVSKP